MKSILKLSLAFGLLATTLVHANIYNDATNDTTGFQNNLDIVSVEVSNDATDIHFTITTGVNNPGWGSYMISIKTPASWDLRTDNPWSRPLTFSNNPINYWVGVWTDSGGGSEFFGTDEFGWNNLSPANGLTFSTNSPAISFSIPYATLGMGELDTFSFDAFSSTSIAGTGAIDSLNDPNQTITEWNGSYNSTLSSSYQIVPEPSTYALLALSAAGVFGYVVRHRRRQS
jgi:hypothetical protein